MIVNKTTDENIGRTTFKRYYDITVLILLLISCTLGYFLVRRHIKVKRTYCCMRKISSPQEFKEYFDSNKSRMDVTHFLKICSEKALTAMNVKKFKEARAFLQMMLSECDTEQLRQETVLAIAETYFFENNLPMSAKYVNEILSAKKRIPLYYNNALDLQELIRKAETE